MLRRLRTTDEQMPLIRMRPQDYLFLHLGFDLLFEIFHVNRALCGLCCLHETGSKMNSIKITVIKFPHIHHKGYLRHDNAGTTATVIHANHFNFIILPSLILTRLLRHSFKAFQTTTDTTYTLNVLTCYYSYPFLCHKISLPPLKRLIYYSLCNF